jgi:hypothetical protein
VKEFESSSVTLVWNSDKLEQEEFRNWEGGGGGGRMETTDLTYDHSFVFLSQHWI